VRRPRLLDLFCGAGGAAMGYARAGFDVVGVDLKPQPRYPFEFHQGDALEFLAAHGSEFDAIHASPPCQGYTQFSNLNAERWGNRVEHPMLIDAVRALLRSTGAPWIIENVLGAPMRDAVILCGTMFGLGVQRHRKFESNMLLLNPPHCRHRRDLIAVYGKLDGRRVWSRADGSQLRNAKTLAQAREAMGVDWMEWNELKESIPPAYTSWLGSRLLETMKMPHA